MMVERPGSKRPVYQHERPVMPRNVVFDLGNVLISFKPSEFLAQKNYNPELSETIMNDIFRSRDWQLVDEGAITISEAISNINTRSSLKRHEITQIFDYRKEILFPLDQNIKILPELKKHGFKLYYLSNFPMDIFEDIRYSYGFFKYFDGGIISAEVKLAKPDARIYRSLIEKYSLIAGECLYIDDLEINVTAAESAGMTGYHTSGSLEISEEIRRRLGIRIE